MLKALIILSSTLVLNIFSQQKIKIGSEKYLVHGKLIATKSAKAFGNEEKHYLNITSDSLVYSSIRYIHGPYEIKRTAFALKDLSLSMDSSWTPRLDTLIYDRPERPIQYTLTIYQIPQKPFSHKGKGLTVLIHEEFYNPDASFWKLEMLFDKKKDAFDVLNKLTNSITINKN